MITISDETWATTTLRDAQDPGAGAQRWKPITRLTLERYNLIFSQVESRGYATTGEETHDCATALENGFAALCKVTVGGASNGMGFTKWTVASGLEYDDEEIVAGANISDTARPSIELTAGTLLTIRVFYVGDGDANIHYIESADGGDTWTAEQNVGAATDVTAIASVSTTKVHWVSVGDDGNSRLHVYEDDGGWSSTDSLIYWPHEIEYIDAITIGDRDLIVFYSDGPMYGKFRTAGIYGCWYKHGRWSDFFHIDVLDEATDYAYRKSPMISEANDIYFLTGFLSEGDSEYSHTDRFVKTSKDGQYWSQYMPLVCSESGPAKLLVIEATAGYSWLWNTAKQCYVCGFDRIYESNATRYVGETNTDLQEPITERTKSWSLQRGVIASANTIVSNHDGCLDNHTIVNADNTLVLVREAGYHTAAGDEYAQLTLEEVDLIKGTTRLPQRHKQIISRDHMKWVRDNEADHFEEWVSQLLGYDNYHDNTETGYGGLSHTATQNGWWETEGHMLWLRSNNSEGLAFATWSSEIMNGQAGAWIRLESASNSEYAGVVFRARDADNFWAAYYDQDTDKIVLKRKTAGTWGSALTQSSALSWSVDTWYYIMVDFRYSYFRVFYSTDGVTFTQAFTYTAEVDLVSGALEYGYVGLVGYGYCDEDEEEAAGYSPPASTLPVNPPVESSVSVGAGGLVYFLDTSTGRLFRTRNARDAAADVAYEDLGVIDASVTHFDLAHWDPVNTAIACGSDGIWRCQNLDSDSPTWSRVKDLSGSDKAATWVCSSPKHRKRWNVAGYDGSGHPTPIIWHSVTNGTAWIEKDISDGQVMDASYTTVKVSMSSHSSSKAWATWFLWGGYQQVCYTANYWSTFTRATPTTDFNAISPDGCQMPSVHHYVGNSSDLEALYCGRKDLATDTVYIAYGDNDYTGLTTVAILGGYAVSMGCCAWRDDFFWLLMIAASGDPSRFYVSEDRITWTATAQWADTIGDIDVWPADPDLLVAAVSSDGTHALKISSDGGSVWQDQTGDWDDLGYDSATLDVVKMVYVG